ncbi:archaea-specific SMC-related protein [Halodesulfurarchaeum sp.]|uniref:archaea-specific SMC-related protein n=1 Tax=Halodesulfurarchaeum sp. TaxID=1980530 RepID=UPI002FC28631
MAHTTTETPQATVSVENIGGISETSISLSPGVTVLKGENATNRTSFLQAVMGALGSDKPSIKADADAGRVELQIGNTTYTRRFERTGTGVRASGEPYLDDPTPADTFAFLLETNAARQAVIRRRDLRSVIMEPIDTTAIQAEITHKQARKSQLDEQIAELDSLRSQQPELTERKTRIEADIEDKRAELEAVREEIAGAEADLTETKETKDAMEAAFEEVQMLRSDLASVRDRLDAERNSLTEARTEQDELAAELESAPESVRDKRGELENRVSTLRETKSRLESAVSELQNLVQYNEDLIDGEESILTELDGDTTAVTDQLVGSDSVTCWTCGSSVERSQIIGTIDRLRELQSDKLDRISDLETEIDSVREDIEQLEEQMDRRQELEHQLDRTENEIESRVETIEGLEKRRDELETEIESTEAEIESLEFAQSHDELLDLHQTANRLEIEIEQLETDRDEIESQLKDIVDRLERQDELETERESVTEVLTELRTRVERIETEAIAEFNDRMEEILDIMGYENIARIWIERRGAEETGDTEFHMHVVRNDRSGTAYEDSIDHLSESEREVTGLVFALAGYLVHEVSETVPFMLLDSVEALDSDRIARLVDYFEDHVPYLLIALLPEDAQALDDSYHRVMDI